MAFILSFSWFLIIHLRIPALTYNKSRAETCPYGSTEYPYTGKAVTLQAGLHTDAGQTVMSLRHMPAMRQLTGRATEVLQLYEAKSVSARRGSLQLSLWVYIQTGTTCRLRGGA